VLPAQQLADPRELALQLAVRIASFDFAHGTGAAGMRSRPGRIRWIRDGD
jgi:hypothetical protein